MPISRIVGDRLFLQRAVTAAVALAVLAGCGVSPHDVLGVGINGSAQVGLGASKVGTPHYFGYTPLSVGGKKPVILLSASVVGPAPGEVSVQVWTAPFNGDGTVGGADGDAELAKGWPHLVRKPLRGAVVPAQAVRPESFYILFRVVAHRPGRIVITGLKVRYRLDGATLSHVFHYSVVIDDHL